MIKKFLVNILFLILLAVIVLSVRHNYISKYTAVIIQVIIVVIGVVLEKKDII